MTAVVSRSFNTLLSTVLLGVFAVAAPNGADRISSRSPFVLNLDYSRFRFDDGSGYLEVYYAFYPRLLTFEFESGKYRGAVELTTVITNKLTGEIPVNERRTLPMVIGDTSDAAFRSTFVSQAGYQLKIGEYLLKVLAVDSLNQTQRDSLSLTISVQPYVARLTSSDIEMCSNIRSSDDKNDPFYKNSFEVIPNPTLVFGATAYPVVFHYLELYNLQPESTYTIKTLILDASEKIVRQSSKDRKFGVQNAIDVGTTNVSSIYSGRYRFEFAVFDKSSRELTRSRKIFYIYNPHVQPQEAGMVSAKSSEMAGLTAEELANEFRMAQYVATDQEIQSFKELTSADGRREFLARLWVEAENGRHGKDPITRMEYLQRASVANQRYRALSRDGWRTDRGRVYILYGEPDEIERAPSRENTKPYETWHYYRIENGVQFVFIDRSGFGDFILVHSTKRGELRDDQWQRFLQ